MNIIIRVNEVVRVSVTATDGFVLEAYAPTVREAATIALRELRAEFKKTTETLEALAATPLKAVP